MLGKTIKFIPSSDDEVCQRALKENNRAHLSAKIIKVHEGGAVDLTVSVPDNSNVLRTEVSFDAAEATATAASKKNED